MNKPPSYAGRKPASRKRPSQPMQKRSPGLSMVSFEKGQQTSSQRGNAGDASKNTVQKVKGKQKAEEMVKWYTKCRKPKKRKLTNSPRR
jgi:hypothetical protein